MKRLSRRSALFSVALLSMLRSLASDSADIRLIRWGRRFDALASKVDHAIEQGLHIDWGVLEELGETFTAIGAAQARTIEGLCVKARLISWSRLGDFSASEQSTADDQMSLSIIRDLIRMHHPELERPGALRTLVQENEESSPKSRPVSKP